MGRDGVGRTLNLLQDLTPGSVEEAEEAEPDEEFKDAIEVWAWRGAGWPYRVAERGRGLLGGSRVGAGEGRNGARHLSAWLHLYCLSFCPMLRGRRTSCWSW